MDKEIEITELLLHENNLAQTWLGDIKKAFQQEQHRLVGEGVTLRMKPVWQAINEAIWASTLRRRGLSGKIEEKTPEPETDQPAEKDELFDEAVAIVRADGRAGTALLQRKLKIGYVKSSILMDQLEAHGIIGLTDGAKPRIL